jgi:hypothetical protein
MTFDWEVRSVARRSNQADNCYCRREAFFALELDCGDCAIVGRWKNRPVTGHRYTKQGAERQADERVMRNDQHTPVRARGRHGAQSAHAAASSLIRVFASGIGLAAGSALKRRISSGKSCSASGMARTL